MNNNDNNTAAAVLAELAEILDSVGGTTGEWNGADLCDAVYLMLKRADLVTICRECDHSHRKGIECPFVDNHDLDQSYVMPSAAEYDKQIERCFQANDEADEAERASYIMPSVAAQIEADYAAHLVRIEAIERRERIAARDRADQATWDRYGENNDAR